MNLDSLREYCLSFPAATENVQWGADLVFKIGGKMFTVACLTPGETKVSFKCTPETFAELVEQEDIKPADYVARYHWVTLESWSALPDREIRKLIQQSYEMVRAKLPKTRVSQKSKGQGRIVSRTKTGTPPGPRTRAR